MNGNEIKNFREKVLSLKDQISDKDFFASSQCHAYLQNLAEAITKQYSCGIHLGLSWGDPEGPVAFATDRSELFLNVNNCFFNECSDRVSKLVILKALILHECGHLLFSDYHLMKSAVKVFTANRKLFPEPKCEEYKDWMADANLFEDSEMQEWLQIWKMLENSIEDGFIEQMVLKTVPGDGQCLYPLRNMQKEEFKSIKGYRNDGLDNSAILFNCILSLAKYGTVKMDKDDKDDETIKALLKNYNLIQEAVNTQKSYDRMKLINTIFCKLYRFMKEEKEKETSNSGESNDSSDETQDSENNDSSQGNGSSGDSQQQNSESQSGSQNQSQSGGSSSGQNDSSNPNNGTENQKQNNSSGQNGKSGSGSQNKPSAGNLLQNATDTSINDQLDTNSGSVLNDNNINQKDTPNAPTNNQDKLSQMQKQEENTAQMPTPSDMREAESIAESIAKDQANEEAEKELAEQRIAEAQDFDYGQYNKGENVKLIREQPSSHSEQIYRQDMEEICFLSKKMVREIKDKIKDQQQGGKINGLYQGRYLDQHSLSRFDCRCLCKNDLPEDIPDMAIGVLIDMSGSMSGQNKYVHARRTALLLYEFGRQLNIPVMVYAHKVGGKVQMYDLADFESVDGKDRYRICDMTPGGCNRDGMALRFCSEKLSKRHEQNKFLFVISDGLPSDYSSAQDGEKDIKGVLMDYSKKNVKYIAVGLGSDQQKIEQLYTQNLSPKVAAKFLQCEDPTALPVTVVQTIKQLIKVR